jgi:multicomponent Na+:H+ antiporter subunit G
MLETLFYIIIGVGLGFDLLGCLGLVRLPDVYNRAQAATKCVTLGTCLILIGVAGLGFADGAPAIGVKALICALFILLTSPVAAHAICRGAYLMGVPLWEGSVEDRFADRAQEIREHHAAKGRTAHEDAETA